MDIVDQAEFAAAIEAVAAEEPDTVAAARRVAADPAHAAALPADERQTAWLVLLAARRQRGAAARIGGTAA